MYYSKHTWLIWNHSSCSHMFPCHNNACNVLTDDVVLYIYNYKMFLSFSDISLPNILCHGFIKPNNLIPHLSTFIFECFFFNLNQSSFSWKWFAPCCKCASFNLMMVVLSCRPFNHLMWSMNVQYHLEQWNRERTQQVLQLYISPLWTTIK